MNTSPREQLVELLHESPDSAYDEIASRLRKAHLLFREYVSRQLQDPLNAKLKGMPHDSYEDKQRLALWLNSELLSFGIAAKCPKTDLPCSIHAERVWKRGDGQLRMR